MNIINILDKKRHGRELDTREIDHIIQQISNGSIPDYQIAALLMAIAIQSMTARETTDLTNAMTHSGSTIDLSDIPGAKIDKHSTGGVGDKVSLVLAPLAAAAGVKVPMISGRSLGHTGGTLDKLESIPGFRTDLSIDEFKSNIADIGLCIIGQTDDLVPADKIMYALRDTTATVSSIPLITSSILSKKLAEGINALVLDIKVGNGSFLPTRERAEALAASMLHTAELNNMPMTVVLSDMDQPLGNTAGNWIEVLEVVQTLQGKGPADLRQLCLVLTGHMLVIANLAPDLDTAMIKLAELLDNGAAWDKFLHMVQSQGGDPGVFAHPEKIHVAQHCIEIQSPQGGYISAINTRQLGEILTDLGGGRRTKNDAIDPAAGLEFHAKKGDLLQHGGPLLSVYCNKIPDDLKKELTACYTFQGKKPDIPHLIYNTLTAKRT